MPQKPQLVPYLRLCTAQPTQVQLSLRYKSLLIGSDGEYKRLSVLMKRSETGKRKKCEPMTLVNLSRERKTTVTSKKADRLGVHLSVKEVCPACKAGWASQC